MSAPTKPDPRIFLEAVRRAGAAASDSLYVGDQYEIDVLGARRAGLKGCCLTAMIVRRMFRQKKR